MQKPAPTERPIHDLVRRRWSPRAFSAEPVPRQELLSVLEAARWSASCFNDQPWSFLVGLQGDATWQGIHDCLVPANQAWAGKAPVLILSLANESFVQTGKPNRHAQYDVGQAVGAMALQATALGLFVHQMAGFDSDRARARFEIPPAQTPMTAIALGHAGDPDELPEALAKAERAPRERVPLATFVFQDAWGTPVSFVKTPDEPEPSDEPGL